MRNVATPPVVIVTMSDNDFSGRWQSCAFELSDYAKEKAYSVILSLIIASDRSRELMLNGNQSALRTTRLNDTDAQVLAKALHGCQDVVHLNLSYNTLTDKGIKYIAECLKDPSCSIQMLDLSYNDFGAEGTEALADALQFNTSVSTLVLNGNSVGRKGGIHIASMLQVNRTISTLGLASTYLDTDCIIAMATILNGNTSLKCMDLSRPLLRSKLEETTIHISRMLQMNHTLQELHLCKHGITDTGVEWMCRLLRDNTALLHLNISWVPLCIQLHQNKHCFYFYHLRDSSRTDANSLSQDGAGHIASLLKANPPLTILDLSYNRIEDDGMVYISEALEANFTLQRLNVCNNNIGDKGLCKLVEALKRNSTLTTVSIWGNRLGEPVCNAFRGLLESSRLQAENTDVRPYEVDGTTYLARTDLL